MFISPLMLESAPRLPPFPTGSRVADRWKAPSLPLPSELPDSDGVPVDNDLQYLVSTLLRQVLHYHWRHQSNWFFGINMGIYYHGTGFNPRVPIVPDAFISLGVEPPSDPKGRLSYIVWLEQNLVPVWVLECVSQTYGEEYDEKMDTYARMGVLHYVIYNPHFSRRDRHDSLEVYRLGNGQYQRCPGDQIWFPELQLALGGESGTFQKWTREWLYWYDRAGKRVPLPEEELVLAQQRAERLAQLLRDRGIEFD